MNFTFSKITRNFYGVTLEESEIFFWLGVIRKELDGWHVPSDNPAQDAVAYTTREDAAKELRKRFYGKKTG